MTQSQPTTTSARRRPDRGDVVLFLTMTLAGAALDVGSKYAVFAWLGGKIVPEYSLIDGFLQFIVRENIGAAFSIMAGRTWVFIAISVVALVVVNGMFWLGKFCPRLMVAAMACLNAGILGNLYDRLFNEGRVRDFIDVYVGDYHWPTFNVADSLLCIGVGLLIVLSFIAPKQPASARPVEAGQNTASGK